MSRNCLPTFCLQQNIEMFFRPCLLLFLIFTTVAFCKPTKQDENGSEDEDYDHEEGYRDNAPVVEDKVAPICAKHYNFKAPPDDGSPECHKIYNTRLEQQDADVEEQPTERDKKISGQADAPQRQERISQSKRRISGDLSKNRDNQNFGAKLAEIDEEGADVNYEGADLDWNLDYIDDKELSNKFNIQPVRHHKNGANKKNKHWFDFYRNRRHVPNTKMQRANANGKGPEDEETAIKRHIKKLTTDELELLLKSLSNEKRILLQSIIDSDENVNKREITKKAGAEDENNMMVEAGSRQSKEAVHEAESDVTQKSLSDITAKTLETRSADINENEDKMDNVAEIMDSDYDFNESAMLQSAKSESKRDTREDYDVQSEDPDYDDENVKSNTDRRISNKRLHKRTADTRESSLAESMKSLEESFSNNLNSEMLPLIRVKRTHDNGRSYTHINRSLVNEEENNELDAQESNEADNMTLPLPGELQASLVSAEGENILDSIEAAEPDVTYTINNESPEIKNWNLLNCSCENVSFEIPPDLPDDNVNSDIQSSRSTKDSGLNHPKHPAMDLELKHEGRISPDLKVISNIHSEKSSIYQDSEALYTVPKAKGLQRSKRIRRVKSTSDN